MKKALQQFEKKVRTAYEFSQQGLNYRCNVRVNDVMIGNISMNLTKSNQIANMLISELFDNQSFNVYKDKSDLIFRNNFDELKTLETTSSYYPETGFLVFDQNLKTLKIHLTRESKPCEGVLLGYVMNSQSLHVLQQLRELDGSCKLFIEGSYNFYLKRTLNILLGVSLIYFLNGITFNPKNEVTSLFVRNEKELQYIQKQN